MFEIHVSKRSFIKNFFCVALFWEEFRDLRKLFSHNRPPPFHHILNLWLRNQFSYLLFFLRWDVKHFVNILMSSNSIIFNLSMTTGPYVLSIRSLGINFSLSIVFVEKFYFLLYFCFGLFNKFISVFCYWKY